MKTLSVALGLALVLGGATTASAQTPRPERPYRGLFAGGLPDLQQSLTVNGSLGGGYDTDVLAQARLGTDPRLRRSGSTVTASGSLNYSVALSRFNLGASAGTSARYYPSVRDDIVRAYNGNVSATVKILTRPALSASQLVGYQPVSLNSLFPVLVEGPAGVNTAPELIFVNRREHYLAYAGGAALTHDLSQRNSLSANYGYRLTNGLYSRRFLSQSMGATLRRRLTRDLGLKLGYAYSEGRYGADDSRPGSHNADIGVDYSRALSFSRRTTLSFATGSSATVQSGQTRFHASGSAELNHEIGRTWHAAATYNRGLQFVETLRQPVFSDSATASVSGLLTRRIDAHAHVRTAIGSIGIENPNGFDSYTAGAGMSIAVVRSLSVGVNYSYYQHSFTNEVQLPAGFPSSLDRHSLHIGVSVWAPLFQQRSSNASR